MRPGPTSKIHDDTRDILGPAQPTRRVRLGMLLQPARQLQQPARHLRREEAGADRVHQDVPRAQVDGEVAPEMQYGGLGSRVSERGLAAEGADAEAGGAGRDDDARGVLLRGAPLQERRELLHRHEHGLDVEVHDLGEGRLGMRVEALAPGRAGVGEEDVDVLRVLRHLRHQRLDALDRGAVGRRRDGARAGLEVRELVELRHGRLAGLGLS